MNGISNIAKKKRKRREKKCLIVNKSSQSIVDESCSKSEKYAEDKAELFWHMLQDNQPYTTQVRIGMAFQAVVPEWTGRVKDDAESLFLGEPFEKEGAQHNLMNDVWKNGWQPIQSVFPGSDEKEDIEMQRLLRILLSIRHFFSVRFSLNLAAVIESGNISMSSL